jgi:hypothetical protein
MSPGPKLMAKTRASCSEAPRWGDDNCNAEKRNIQATISQLGQSDCELRHRHGIDGEF